MGYAPDAAENNEAKYRHDAHPGNDFGDADGADRGSNHLLGAKSNFSGGTDAIGLHAG
jgi:hypothetical protein